MKLIALFSEGTRRTRRKKNKKDNEDKLEGNGAEVKKMIEYRAQLDKERDQRLNSAASVPGKKIGNAISSDEESDNDDSDNDDGSATEKKKKSKK